MDLGIQGRKAVITGASKGIGGATARCLAAEGVDVHLVARHQATLAPVAAEISERFGVAATFSALDLSNTNNVDALFDELADPIDIFVNNAGAIPFGNLDLVDEDAWREGWELKVFGYIAACRRAYARMRDVGRGVIINIIGAAGERPNPEYPAGSAGNAALMALTRALGGSSLEHCVRIVGINPGATMTDRLINGLKATAQRRFGDPGQWERFIDKAFPPAEPEHIASMAAFLASDLSASTTGTIVTIDGGQCAR